MTGWQKLLGKQPKQAEDIRALPIGAIVFSPFQPRIHVDDDAVAQLAASLHTHGMIQPIVVRKRGDQYELIVGERRLRAAQANGWETVPAIVREMTDTHVAATAIIENVQRENLTPIEEANAYAQLMDLCEMTQEALAQRVGKSQSAIANKLRLLQLCDDAKDALLHRRITERHARALLALRDPEQQTGVLQETINKQWSVKQTEQRVEQLLHKSPAQKQNKSIALPKNLRLAINTVRQSIQLVEKTGMHLETIEQEHEEHYEIIIRIAKNPSQRA